MKQRNFIKRIFKQPQLKKYFLSTREFVTDENGLGTVEIVIIIAILVGLALIFRKQIYSFVNQIFTKIFSDAGSSTLTPGGEENPDNLIG